MIGKLIRALGFVLNFSPVIALLCAALYIDMQMHPLWAAEVLVVKDTQMLYVVDDLGTVTFESKVIIGRDSRPTPNFTDEITHIVTNPYWNIPRNLLYRDVLPKIRKNPALFDSMGMQVLHGDQDVSQEFKQTLEMQPGWRMRQLPDENNALGLTKFMLRDKMKSGPPIFLHDTNHRELYAENERRFSSGCIRVEKWEEFSKLLGIKYVPSRQERWNKIEPVTIHVVGQ